MLTSQQVREFQQADIDLDTVALARLDDLLGGLRVTDPAEFTAGVLDTLPGLVSELSDVSALLGASMYELAREQAEARGRFTVDLAEPPNLEQVQASARWALAPMWAPGQPLIGGALNALLTDRLGAATPRLVREGGRRTVTENSSRDPAKPRYQRNLGAARTKHCDFCALLVSRGAVYHTEDSAGAGRHFHDRCHCYITLEF